MRRWGVVVAVGLSIIIFSIDMNIVALALPVMGHAFQQTDEAMSAVILSYSIPLTLLMLPFGLIVTRGRPVVTFVLGIGGFGLGSVLCAIAPSFSVLLIGRAVQGIFGSLVMTQGVALVGAAIEPHQRGRAMGIIGSMGPLGAITGPGLGGLLISRWDWPAIFLINVPIVLLVMALAALCLPGVSFGSSRINGLVQMGYLMRHRRFLGTLLILLCSSSVFGGLAFVLPFTLQDVHQLDLTLAGATMLMPSLAIAIISPLGGYLSDRFGVRTMLPTGWSVALFALILLLPALAAPTSVLDLNWRLLLLGLGNGLANGPLVAFMMSIGPRQTLGAVSAISGVTRQLGFICGPALVSLFWSSSVGSDPSARASSGISLLIAFALVGFTSVLFSIRGLAPAQPPTEEATPAVSAD